MNQRSHLSVVREQSLPPPLLPAGIDLEDLPSFMIDVDWVTNPRFWSRVPRDAKMAAVELQVASTMESPAGSLPSDEEGLALAAGLLSDVDAWRSVADLALRGWTLCADGRYYRPDVAKKMLHVWIVRLNDRRRGAAGQAKKRKEEFDPSQFDADIAIAVACMTRLDPYAPILRNYRNAQPDVEPASATAPSNAPSNSKLSEAKPSEAESSSPRRGDDSSVNPGDGVSEIGSEQGSAKRTVRREPVVPWPPDWFARIKALYPRKEAWGRAEKVLDRLRKADKVAFDDLLAGIEHLIAQNRAREYTPLLARWLNDRGWEDEPVPRVVQMPSLGGRAPSGQPGSEPSITQRAAMLAAERLGLLDEPRSRG